MMSTNRSPFPIIKKTHFDVKPGQSISVQDFLTGLKKPARAAIQHRTLHEASPMITARCEGQIPFESKSNDPHIMDPPESCVQEETHDQQQERTHFPAEEADPSTPKPPLFDERESTKVPTVVRTYAKRRIPPPSPTKTQREDRSSLGCPQGAKEPRDGCQLPSEGQGNGESLPAMTTNRQTSSSNTVEPALAISPGLTDDKVSSTRKKTKSRYSKKRRAPVNELPLVLELPAQEGTSVTHNASHT